MKESLKRCEPLKIYELTKAGNSYEVTIDRVDSKGNLYPYNHQQYIPLNKLITTKEDQKFWRGNRYFATDELMTEVIHEESTAGLAVTPSCEEVMEFWKEFCKKNPD